MEFLLQDVMDKSSGTQSMAILEEGIIPPHHEADLMCYNSWDYPRTYSAVP